MNHALSPESLFSDIRDGLYLVDRTRRITFWNKAAESITGFAAREVIGSCCFDNLLVHVDKHGNELCRGMCPLAATMADGDKREAEIFLHHKDGHRIPVWVRSSPLLDNTGAVIGGMELFSPIELPAPARILNYQLDVGDFSHALTGLPQRRYLEAELETDLFDLREHNYCFGAVLFNIDGTGRINQHYGNDVGDRLLCAIAKTLASCVRPFDTLGHWDGDSFLGIFPVRTLPPLYELVNRLRILAGSTFVMHENRRISAAISCGGAMALLRDSADTLTKRAEMCLVECKRKGGNQCIVETNDATLQ